MKRTSVDTDNQDFEFLLVSPDMVEPGDELIYTSMDQFNGL